MVKIEENVIIIESINHCCSKETLVIDLYHRSITSVKMHDFVREDKYAKLAANYRKAYGTNMFGMLLEIITEPGVGTTSTKSIKHEIVYNNAFNITQDFNILLKHMKKTKS